MKSRKPAGDIAHRGNNRKQYEVSSSKNNRNMGVNKSKKKNFQRLGGGPGGLSLEAFANAKTKNDGYNPALIKKKKEFYRNAKWISKYKKTLKQLSHQENDQGGQNDHIHLPPVRFSEVSDKDQGASGSVIDRSSKIRSYTKKGSNRLEEIYTRTCEEKEKARKEREAIINAKKEEREKAEARRKELKEKMFKRTRKGQPVMKYRIEHLLETLRSESGI